MQDLAEFLRRHSRKHLSLQRKNSQHKGSDYSLRRKSQQRSNVKMEVSVVDRHHKSINPNNLSTPTLKKDLNSGFLRGKSLYKEYRLEEACKEFERVLVAQPNHAEALYLSGISYLNLNRVSESIKYLERLQHGHPQYKSNMYLLLAIGHNKLKNSERALQFLSQAISKYERFLEAHCYRAKIYLGLRKHQKAEEDFDAALLLDPTKQVAIVGKADCLRMRGSHREAIKHYSMALELQKSPTVLLKRAVACYQNDQPKEALFDLAQLLRLECSTEAYYYRGKVALEYEKDEAAAVLYFEQAVKEGSNPNLASKAAQQLLKIKIDICDFYECTSILQWAQFYKVEGLDAWVDFIDGVVCLMKKKPDEGEKLLAKTLQLLDKSKTTTDYDYLYPLARLYHAYSLFCLFKYEAGFNEYLEYQRFVETVLGKEVEDHRVRYNKLLCEALMLCEGQFFEESLDKLKELVEIDTSKVEPYFYQCMVLLKIAFSDTPFTQEHESRDEILLSVLEIIEQRTHLQASPSVMFYDGLLKAYFALYQESEKSLSKAIEKGEEHLAKYFYWRAIINSQLGSNEQALTDITVAINIEEKPQYIIGRCRLYQLQKKSEEAYEDLQKYIELEPNQHEVSKWAAVILFMNRAYDEAERALAKLPYVDDQLELQQVATYLNFIGGRFAEAGKQGQLVQDVLEGGEDTGRLDQLISGKDKFGYLSNTYLYFLRVVKNYLKGRYSAAIKDLQYLMFISKGDEVFIQVKYNIMVCHLLNGDVDKATSLFKGMQELQERLNDISQALQSNSEKVFDDLSDYYPKRRLSEHLDTKQVPNTNIHLKLSIPLPEFPDPSVELKLNDHMIHREVRIEAVQGKGEAPWIRRSNPTATVQFTSHLENVDISLQTSQGQSRTESKAQ